MKIIDQLNNELKFDRKPKRIISLVPSQTELICDLGLQEELIGITKFCIHPKKAFKSKPRVGGTKQVNIEKVKELDPDIILANKEENIESDIIALREICPVYVSDVDNLESALSMISDFGEIFDCTLKAADINKSIRENFEKLNALVENKVSKSVLYFIWEKPYMAAGTDCFINDMLDSCHLKNCLEELGEAGKRYPALTAENIEQLNPQLILLSSEPFPFAEKHQKEIADRFQIPTILVDGEMFSWYGSRLKQSPLYFARLLENIF